MVAPSLFAAIDLGASSARMSAGRLEGDRLVVREVARLPNGPVQLPDGIHWDLTRDPPGHAGSARTSPSRAG